MGPLAVAIPATRTKAVMPTAMVPTTENVICQASDGIRCFTMPWVAWKPATAAGATKMTATQSFSHIGRAIVFEEAGYSMLGPVALNVFAPDEGNMHLLEVVAQTCQNDLMIRRRFAVLAADDVQHHVHRGDAARAGVAVAVDGEELVAGLHALHHDDGHGVVGVVQHEMDHPAVSCCVTMAER